MCGEKKNTNGYNAARIVWTRLKWFQYFVPRKQNEKKKRTDAGKVRKQFK